MLLQIAPDMFKDERYKCNTIKDVHDELFGTQKFKNKYPWRTTYKSKMRTLPETQMKDKKVAEYLDTIRLLINNGTVNNETNELFDISYVDSKIIACSLAYGYTISTGEKDIVNFAKQEFPDEFKGTISALGIINMWLRDQLFKWDETKQKYLSKWKEKGEHKQPKSAIKQFQKLTHRKYPGS